MRTETDRNYKSIHTKTVINILFVAAVVLCIAAGFVMTVFFPHEINEYENRYAEKIADANLQNYTDGSFQDSVELALADQIPFAEALKEEYNLVRASFSNSLIAEIYQTDIDADEQKIPDISETASTDEGKTEDKWAWLMEDPEDTFSDGKYITLADGTMVFEGHLVYGYTPVEWCCNEYDKHIENINSLALKYPDIDFYAYYIEKESDNNFETGEHMGNAEYILSGLTLPESQKGFFSVNSFANFDRLFYRVDHHWNYLGSYRGYRNLMSMLLPEAELLEPIRTVKLGDMKGSKNTGYASSYQQDMEVFEFDFPEMTYTANGQSAEDYGTQSTLITKADAGEEITKVTYGQFYGQDIGETIIRNDNAECEDSILLIGESFDNALLKLIACHFSTVYSIDMRNYSAQNNGAVFDFDAYVTEHEIDRVLFIGNIDFWIMDEFLIDIN